MSLFHEGELAVQAKVGTQDLALLIAKKRMDNAALYAAFLEKSQLAVAASIHKDGRVWASALAGELGFVSLQNPKTSMMRVWVCWL